VSLALAHSGGPRQYPISIGCVRVDDINEAKWLIDDLREYLRKRNVPLWNRQEIKRVDLKSADLVAGFFRNNWIRKNYWKLVNVISEKDMKTTTTGPPYLTGIQLSNKIVKLIMFKLFDSEGNLLFIGVRICLESCHTDRETYT